VLGGVCPCHMTRDDGARDPDPESLYGSPLLGDEDRGKIIPDRAGNR
jgi:hypothetical protein